MTCLRTAVKKAGSVGQDEEQVVNILMQRTPYLAANPFDMYVCKLLIVVCPKSLIMNPRYTSRDSYMAQALAALVISFSPNLESLRLGPLGRYMSDYEIRMFRRAGQEAHRVHLPLERLFARANSGKSTTFLQNLRKVHFIDEGEDDDGRYYHDHDLFLSIWYVHNLPVINSISVAYMCLDPENGRQEFPVSSSNIRDIEIIHSNVESKHLAVLISATKRLEQFTYATGGRCYLNRGKARFDPRTIIKALLLHRESLEVLDLDVDSQISFYHLPRFPPDFEDMADWDENNGEDNWDTERKRTHAAVRKLIALQTGSLRDFVAMTDLSVGIKSLILMARGVDASNDDHDTFTLADCLPPNLESLCIRGYEKGVYPADDGHIDALIAQVQDGKLPLLKEVTGVEECKLSRMLSQSMIQTKTQICCMKMRKKSGRNTSTRTCIT
jgi:hypothetical protein